MNKKNKVFLSAICLLVAVQTSILLCSANSNQSASQIELKHDQMLIISEKCDDYIEWSFSGSNQSVGLKAYLFDETNYLLFKMTGTGKGYELSNGVNFEKEGVHQLKKESTWYFIIQNDHPSNQSTYVDYSVTFINKPNYMLIFLITSITIGVINIFLVIRLSKRFNAVGFQNQNAYNRPTGIYCRNCGQPNPINSLVCGICGQDLDKHDPNARFVNLK